MQISAKLNRGGWIAELLSFGPLLSRENSSGFYVSPSCGYYWSLHFGNNRSGSHRRHSYDRIDNIVLEKILPPLMCLHSSCGAYYC